MLEQRALGNAAGEHTHREYFENYDYHSRLLVHRYSQVTISDRTAVLINESLMTAGKFTIKGA
ncbi:MAG: hypothetical protein CMQ45_00130 [Gammaproteobacteria bacterium]|nr:hypothetical protein [Gammaproteobacteria bacterium]